MNNTNQIRANCPGCGVGIGHLHEKGCNVERDPDTGQQMAYTENYQSEAARIAWSGRWPGDEDCEKLGLYAKFVPGHGFHKTTREDSDGSPDLNRLIKDFDWDSKNACYVKRKGPEGSRDWNNFSDTRGTAYSLEIIPAPVPVLSLNAAGVKLEFGDGEVREILPYLHHFVKTGGLEGTDPNEEYVSHKAYIREIRETSLFASTVAYNQCEAVCVQHALRQTIRAASEDNDYARERTKEAESCAASIRELREAVTAAYKDTP